MTKRLLTILAAVGALACAPSEPTIDGNFAALLVKGRVQTADGTAVLGATLEMWARSPETCTGGYADGAATSDSTGQFSRIVGNWSNEPRDVCLWIAVTPPAGSAHRADTVTYRPAQLGFALDSVTILIVLPDAPTN